MKAAGFKPFFVSAAVLCGAVNAQDPSSSSAQAFPTRPVRIVIAPVGGATARIARVIAEDLPASLGQQVIVDNRPAGIIPGDIVVKAPPDGYTLLFHGSS